MTHWLAKLCLFASCHTRPGRERASAFSTGRRSLPGVRRDEAVGASRARLPVTEDGQQAVEDGDHARLVVLERTLHRLGPVDAAASQVDVLPAEREDLTGAVDAEWHSHVTCVLATDTPDPLPIP